MKLTRKELALVAAVFASTYTITSTGVRAYAGYETELEAYKYMQSIDITFNENLFDHAYQADATINTLDAFTTKSSLITNVSADVETIDLATLGETEVTYTINMKDRFDHEYTATTTRTFSVVDEDAPIITLKKEKVSFEEGESFDPMKNIASITDNKDGDIKDNEELVTIESNVDNKTPGKYTVVVNATDEQGNTSKRTYKVTVKEKPVVVQQQATTTSYAGTTYYSAATTTSTQATQSTQAAQTTTQTQQAAAPVQQAAPAVNYGSAGRIYLSNGYQAAAYWGSLWDAGATQGTIDAGDAAFVDGSFNYIADHAAQGFWFDYGTTMTWVFADGSTRTYTCTQVMTGAKGSWVCDQGFDVLDGAGGRLITQTCSGNGLRWAYWS